MWDDVDGCTAAVGSQRRRLRSHPTARSVLVSATVVVLTSCSDSANRSASNSDQALPDYGGVAVDRSVLLAPGTELADGVVVPEGTALVATRFPDPAKDGATGEDLGWNATLLVDDAPLEVWDRMVQDTGMGPGAFAATACAGHGQTDVTGEEGESSTTVVGSASKGRHQWAHCEAHNDRWSLSMSAGAKSNCYSPRPARAAAAIVRCGRLAQRHLHIGWSPVKLPGETKPDVTTHLPEFGPDPGTEEREPAELGAISGTISWLPEAGDPIDAGLDVFLSMGAFVDLGARGVVAPGWDSEFCAFTAVLVSPLAPKKALDSVRVADDQQRVKVWSGTDREGRTWASAVSGAAGGYNLIVLAVERRGDESGGQSTGSWVRVTDCGGN